MNNRRLLIVLAFCLVTLPMMAQNDTVLFSAPGGFYEDVFALQLNNNHPQNHIRYTTNGSCPTAHSRLYKNLIQLDSSMFSKSNIYTIVNSIPSQFYLSESIKHAIVIRAAVFDENDNCVSQTVTNTYCIRALGCNLHGLPMLSIVADSLALFDYETGIFVPGVNYDPSDSTHTGNYFLKGTEWERPINLEFYDIDNQGINQLCGMRTHGGASRWFQQKGMKLYAREEYGKKYFLYRFFKDSPYVKFKHLNLHSFRCSNWLHTGGNEYIAQSIAHNLDIDAMGVRQTVVFLNGEYWGIYTLEEAADEHYLKDHYDADLDSVVIIKYWGVPNYGDPTEWREFLIWMQDADLTQPEDSAFAYSHVDVPSFIDYMLLEIFTANVDWPNNNVKISQMKPSAPFRWMLYDTDGCFSHPTFAAMEHALGQNTNSVVFSRFLDNKHFRYQFCTRYEELSKTYFSYNYMKSLLDQYREIVEDEVETQYQRFRFPSSMDRYYADIERTEAFFSQRDQYFRAEIKDYLGIDEHHAATVSCYPNPANNVLFVETRLIASLPNQTYRITNLMGQTLLQGLITDEIQQIDIASLPAGMYFISVGNLTRKFVVE